MVPARAEVRRSHFVQPSNIGGKAFPGKQGHGFIKRQTDDRRIRPNEFLNESARKALDRIAASLAAPLTRSEIGFDFGRRQALEPHPCLDEFMTPAALGRDEVNSGVNPVCPPRQKTQRLCCLRHDLAFRQDTASDADDRVGPDDISSRKFLPAPGNRRGGFRFFLGEPRGKRPGQLIFARGLIEIDGKQGIRFDPDLLQKFEVFGATPTPERGVAAKPYRRWSWRLSIAPLSLI